MGLKTQPARDLQVVAEHRGSCGLTLGWSWLVGPALAVLLTKVLRDGGTLRHGVASFSVWPRPAPALPMFIRKARADMSLAAAIMPLAVVSTVILMPLMAPFLIPGLTLSSWAIGKPLLLTVLLPLVTGVALKVNAVAGGRDNPPRGQEDRWGSPPAPARLHRGAPWPGAPERAGQLRHRAQVLFIVGMALVSYTFGFGLNQAQRSALHWGCARATAAPCWWPSPPSRPRSATCWR